MPQTHMRAPNMELPSTSAESGAMRRRSGTVGTVATAPTGPGALALYVLADVFDCLADLAARATEIVLRVP